MKFKVFEDTYRWAYRIQMELECLPVENRDDTYYWFYQSVERDLKATEHVMPPEIIQHLQQEVQKEFKEKQS
jgi:hypothetical protein